MEAIARSLNSVPVQLTQMIGKDKVAGFARMFGLPISPKPEWPFVIGAIEVHVMDQAVGYASFANGGMKIDPTGIEEITDGEGKQLWSRFKDMPQPKRIVPREKIEMLNSMLHNAVENGTGTRAKLDGVPAGGKTGTTNSSRDAWFCGFTGNYVGVVWVGNDDYHQMEKVTGGMVPAPIWRDIMTYAHQNIDLKQAPGFPLPPARGGLVADAGKAGKAPAAVAAQPAQAPGSTDRPWLLSVRSAGTLTEIGNAMKDARAQPQRSSLREVNGGGRLALVAGEANH
jgi:penicillin-binding protein 1A